MLGEALVQCILKGHAFRISACANDSTKNSIEFDRNLEVSFQRSQVRRDAEIGGCVAKISLDRSRFKNMSPFDNTTTRHIELSKLEMSANGVFWPQGRRFWGGARGITGASRREHFARSKRAFYMSVPNRGPTTPDVYVPELLYEFPMAAMRNTRRFEGPHRRVDDLLRLSRKLLQSEFTEPKRMQSNLFIAANKCGPFGNTRIQSGSTCLKDFEVKKRLLVPCTLIRVSKKNVSACRQNVLRQSLSC